MASGVSALTRLLNSASEKGVTRSFRSSRTNPRRSSSLSRSRASVCKCGLASIIYVTTNESERARPRGLGEQLEDDGVVEPTEASVEFPNAFVQAGREPIEVDSRQLDAKPGTSHATRTEP